VVANGLSNDIQGRILPAKAFEKILRPVESLKPRTSGMPIRTVKELCGGTPLAPAVDSIISIERGYRDKTSPAGKVPGDGPVPGLLRFAIRVFSYTSMYCLADLSQEKS
jgi:hypothetical protein